MDNKHLVFAVWDDATEEIVKLTLRFNHASSSITQRVKINAGGDAQFNALPKEEQEKMYNRYSVLIYMTHQKETIYKDGAWYVKD